MFNLIKRLIAALPTVDAHCDTADGPTVNDGRTALETGNINYALKWVPAKYEGEVRDVFAKAVAVRGLSSEAAEVADRLFLETMVRVHRMAEGAGFTGIAPSDTPVDPVVSAADEALVTGNLEPVRHLVPAERFDELAARFESARAKRDFPVDDVAAGRDYIHAYVSYFKYAEGEEHDHAHGEHHHGHGH